MKFKLLSLGQKFEYEGDTYVKTSPLLASNIKTSQSKIIPRYATLILLDDARNSNQGNVSKQIDSQQVLLKFNAFYEICINEIEKQNFLTPELKNELDKARDNFSQYLTR